MNRRKLLGLMAAAPLASAYSMLPKEAAALPAVVDALPATTPYPLGYMMDFVDHIAPVQYNNCHTHTYTNACASYGVVKRKIWDGEKFIDWDSANATAVMNKVIQGR